MADPIIAALPARAELAIGLPAVADAVAVLPAYSSTAGLPAVSELLSVLPQVPELLMPSGTVAMLPVRYGVQFVAVGEFGVSAVAVHVAAVEFAGAGDFAAVALQVQARAVAFTGEGTFVASDIPRRFVEFSAVGAFDATGHVVYSAAVEFAGIGALVIVDALQVQSRTAQFSGSASMSATAMQLQSRQVEFSGMGSLVATGVEVHSRTVEFSGSGGFSATGSLVTYPIRRGAPRLSAVSSASTLTVNYPAESQPGDLIIMYFHSGRTSTGSYTHTLGGPTWTQLGVGNHTSNSGLFYGVYRAIRGEETSFTITSSTTSSFRGIAAECIAYEAGTFDTDAPTGTATTVSAVTGGNVTSTAVNVTVPRTELLAVYYGWRSGTTAWSVTWSGTGINELTDQTSQFNGYIVLNSAAYAQQESAGTSATYTVARSVTLAARGVSVIPVQPPH